jgi:hypothetical protein
MNQIYIDTMGLAYEKVVGIQEILKAHGIGSHISANSLCIHTTPEIFRKTRPDLAARILRKGEAPFAQEYAAAVKSESAPDA